MAGNLQQRLDILKSKAQLLTERYVTLLNEKREADATIARLRKESEKQRIEMDVMRQQLENLQVVTTLSPSRESVEKSRLFLAELVRDIDKCINELTE